MSGANSYNAYYGTESSSFLTGSSQGATSTFLENIQWFQVEDREKKFLALANSTEKLNVEGICITGATLSNTFSGAFSGIIGGLSFSSVDI